MQFRIIFRILGILLMIFSLSMLPPIAVALGYGDSSIEPYIISFLITFATGIILWFPVRSASTDLKVRDGFLVTVLIWVVLSIFGSLPFMIAKYPHIPFTDAIFETVSGLTTTGSTVLSGLNFMPHAIMYYRQQLQFLGGMGIVVLAVAILPMLGIGGMQLYRAEVPGPIKDSKLTPRITETAKALWYIYVGLTALCAFCFWISGMSLFDAIGESFATISTGGFTMHDSSFCYYHNSLIEIVGVVFMLLGATNFSLHFTALKRKRLRVYWNDHEFRAMIYLILAVVVVCSITLIYYNHYGSPNAAIIKALFDTTSLITTTGFVAGHFANWPTFIPYLLLFVALIGGCGGSTSGGIKVIRAMLTFKQGGLEIKRLIHPRSIVMLKLGNTSISPDLVQAIWGFIALFISVTVLCILLLLAQGVDITTAIGASIASIANAGAGIGGVANNFEPLNDTSKWILIVTMLAGRLEIFTLLVLITPSFWRK